MPAAIRDLRRLLVVVIPFALTGAGCFFDDEEPQILAHATTTGDDASLKDVEPPPFDAIEVEVFADAPADGLDASFDSFSDADAIDGASD